MLYSISIKTGCIGIFFCTSFGSGFVVWMFRTGEKGETKRKPYVSLRSEKRALNKYGATFCSGWCEPCYLFAAPQLGVVPLCAHGTCRVWCHPGSHTARMWGHVCHRSGLKLPASTPLGPGTVLNSSCSYMKFLLLESQLASLKCKAILVIRKFVLLLLWQYRHVLCRHKQMGPTIWS